MKTPAARASAGEGTRSWVSRTDPTFQIAFLFHDNLDLLARVLPRCLDALCRGTNESYEVVLHCDGTPSDVVARLPALVAQWGVDEMRYRRRARFVSSGDPGTNGHRRLFTTRSPYLIIIEADVVAYRTEASFDPLRQIRRVFEQHADVPVLCTVADSWQWSWKLSDLGEPIEPGVRSVNRVSGHLCAYAMDRFMPVAETFGAFDLDVFIDRDDFSYNWEDLTSHVGTSGGRRIAFPDGWPLHVFHCDRKVSPDSMYHTHDPGIRMAVLDELEAQFGAKAVGA
jgi:hypothetical protein